ncbi:glycosyltransferase [Pararhodobacter zhoushanensis]|uniref:Glycosyltransferase n=1 Tax=Pararhodobacter zhoushanensis TaxID=2479545 RepID=A0ABT3H034_9RHOB|nr:glycosyltransferase [Pararhodobacter zhoushanensis]MCW1933136.1 glycosyltransferase [Pararhodobacter zhoushanensis]
MTAPLRIHAAIISWDGLGAQAAGIADALDGVVDKLSVIYSNASNRRETGAGDWHRVSHDWYFGLKFEQSIILNPAEHALLVIHADAAYHDWPALVARLRLALETSEDLGLWAPDLDNTPWPSTLVGEDSVGDSGLLAVEQTDGVVLALTPPVLARLHDLDFHENKFGWGIDWAAISYCRTQGLSVLRDTTVKIEHAPGRGYDDELAEYGADLFIAQLTDDERLWLTEARARLTRRREDAAQSTDEADSDRTLSDEPRLRPRVFFDTPPAGSRHLSNPVEISGFALMDGRVYVCSNSDLDGKAVHIDANGVAYELERPSSVALRDLPPVNFPIQADPNGWPTQKDGLDEWQVDGWTTYRIGASGIADNRRIPLTGTLRLTAPGEAFRFDAKLALHRGAGHLGLVIADAQGKTTRQLKIPYDARFEGGSQPAGYQSVSIDFPAERGETQISLYLEREPFVDHVGDGTVFFIAEPRVSVVGSVGSRLHPYVYFLNDVAHPIWHVSALPLSARDAGSAVSLIIDAQKFELIAPSPIHVKLTADWGHVLEFSSNTPFRSAIYIDGTFALCTDLAPGDNSVRIPSQFLNGTHRKIELRDEMGVQTLWHSWFLAPKQLTTVDHLRRESRAPYQPDLFVQSPQRFRALRAHCDAGASGKVLQQLTQAIDALEAGYAALKIKPLAFPKVSHPDVSVVIPAHNKVKVTYACLCALLLAHNKASFEVIVVDDGSTDETAQLESIVSGITVIHNAAPKRFIGACNAGVAVAKGRYVVLLNNDTEPTIGWLDELIDAFARFSNVGLVGSKLLYPDGRLQEAGGIIWGTGDPWNYGRLQNPADPRFSYARQADYLSGASMMTTKTIWDEVGGLSSYLEPMYFEDTDFAFKVRDAGYTTWYVPASEVYHYEGMSSGTDVSTGFKRYQEVNRPKFKQRWARACAGFSPVGTAPDLEKDRGIVGRVLFIDYTTPSPDRDAGSYAALQEIRLMQSLGYKVTFMPENLAYMGRYTTDLEKSGVEVITAPFHATPQSFLEQRAHEFDLVYITRYHVVNTMIKIIRERAPKAKVIMNGADLHYLRLLRRGLSANNESHIQEARSVRIDEFNAMGSVDLVVSYNDTEMSIIQAMSEGSIKLSKCPWVLDVPDTTPGREGRAGVSFLGSFAHHPNVEGLTWFAQSVMSLLSTKRPDIVLSVYGSRMGDDMRKLESPTIRPIGYIETVEDAYDSHRVFVAPLLSGAGIKGKVLNALAAGIPTVLSPVAAEGIGLRDGEDCLIAETPQEWVAKITQLTDDDVLWEKIRKNGIDLARRNFSFERGRRQMRAALEAVDMYRSLD